MSVLSIFLAYCFLHVAYTDTANQRLRAKAYTISTQGNSAHGASDRQGRTQTRPRALTGRRRPAWQLVLPRQAPPVCPPAGASRPSPSAAVGAAAKRRGHDIGHLACGEGYGTSSGLLPG